MLSQVVKGRGLGGENGLTVKGLLQDGYEAVFLGIGLPDPKLIPMFQDLTVENGFYSSKNFLPLVSSTSKPGYMHSMAIDFCRAQDEIWKMT